MIKKISLYDLRLPLTVPYGNSLGVLNEFTTIIAVLTDENGNEGVGEATPAQPGYQEESPESIWEFVRKKAPIILNLDLDDAYSYIQGFKDKFPFATTTYLTALEELKGESVLRVPEKGAKFPLVGIINPPKEESLEEHIEKRIAEGYKSLKLKIGYDLEDDIQEVKRIQSIVAGRALLRLDANQAYSYDEAFRFVHSISAEGIELVEQPFKTDRWDDMQRLAKVSPLPLMLDESIFNIDDVKKTGELKCARYIKFKLMKSASALNMKKEIEMARKYNIEILIGNGVASDIGCLHETLIGVNCGVTAAGEQNGFLKPKISIFKDKIQFSQGKMVIPAGYKRELDVDVIKEYSRDSFTIEK
ncbi:MAG: hypothetical protein GX351_07005 [Peptococcaceae bacterium]|nr:hypothetical protein [Peptococcaceae bacterium]